MLIHWTPAIYRLLNCLAGMVHITRLLIFVVTYNTCMGVSVVRDIVVYNNVTHELENKLFDMSLNSYNLVGGRELKVMRSEYIITFSRATKIHKILLYYRFPVSINHVIRTASASLFYGLSQTGSRCLHTRHNQLHININQTNQIATMEVSRRSQKDRNKRNIYMGLALSMSLRFEHIVPIIFRELKVSNVLYLVHST